MTVSVTLARAITDFGTQLGLADLRLGHEGSVCIELEDGLRLDLQAGDSVLFVALCRSAPFAAGSLMVTALQRCDRHAGLEWAPQLGLVGQGAECELLAVDRIALESVSGDQLLACMDRLTDWMQGLREVA